MMPNAHFRSVDEYIASQPKALQKALRRVRKSIVKALPSADEVISYNMPTYKLHDAAVLHFAAWTGHYSLYAASESIMRVFSNELRPYQIDKGTIRFPFGEPVPENLIDRIAKFRAREITPQGRTAQPGP
jgi:uncharacterized protein YdhG (YjbR/CyaY superfamily)